jgi:hypothetical protein
MKKILICVMVLLFVGQAWGTTYYVRSNGSAANKEAATGPCTTAANCMSLSTYAGETFADGDVIVRCHTPIGIPGKIWSEGFVDASVTLSIPAAPTENTRTVIGGNTRTLIGGNTRVTK